MELKTTAPSISLAGQTMQMKKLTCLEVLQSVTLCNQIRESFVQQGLDPAIGGAMSEHAVLGFLSLYLGTEQAFSSPQELLEQLSLEDLLDFYEGYCAVWIDPSGDLEQPGFACSAVSTSPSTESIRKEAFYGDI